MNVKIAVDLILNQDHTIAMKGLDYLLGRKLSNQVVHHILSLEDKLVTGEFLIKYNNFTPNNLRFIEGFIRKNLTNGDQMFVSDLIDFADDLGMEIDYEQCLKLLRSNRKADNSFVVDSAVNYIYKNFKYKYYEEIIKDFNKILDSKSYYQTSQVRAGFALFRITHHKKYLDITIDLIENGQEMNKSLMINILEERYNRDEYFAIPDDLKNILL